MLTKLLNKITNIVKRAFITNVDTTKSPYKLQVTSYGVARDTTMLMPYGLVANPDDNTEGLTFSIGADGSRMYCMPFNPNLIPRGSKGDVILFSNKTTKITLKKNGNINVETNTNVNVSCKELTASCETAEVNATTADVNAATINLNGNVNISGNLVVTGTSTLVSTTTIETKPFLTHAHSGVTSGTSNTGGVA